jgi:tRNA1Val (adenine37-N6)-methyltransferase
MSHPFRFKQFTVHQEHAAMKVGTDGVLLGGWCSVDGARRMLDIGTGTGLIALMLAQRNTEAVVDAVELDAGACADARFNFQASPFVTRLRLAEGDIATLPLEPGYDLIVSNPPFFEEAFLSPELGRTMARHAVSLSRQVLFGRAAQLLADHGRLAVVVPASSELAVLESVRQAGLLLQRVCFVRPLPASPIRRYLLEFGRQPAAAVEHSELVIESGERHQYSDAFKALLRDFYLAF